MIYITPEIKKEIVKRRLGVEICLTTNVVGKQVASYAEHHLKEWLEEDCPIAICTDDVGVVESPSSNEYFLAGIHLSLSYERLWRIALSGIERCFVDEDTQNLYRQNLFVWKEGAGRTWLIDSM